MIGIVVFIVVVLGLLLVGMLYEWRSAARDRQAYPPPGELIDVGGHRLHIHCLGKENDGPSVVFESGSGSSAIDWTLVQLEVAEFTPACAYDRAGYGWSEPGRSPRIMETIVDELHTLLAIAGVKGPYVLVGHAFGGILVRMFAARHPRDVAGLVLVDASLPETFAPDQYDYRGELRRLQRVAFVRRIGLVRALRKKVFPQVQALPTETQAMFLAVNLRNARHVPDEVRPLVNKGVDVPDSLGDLPLAVITRSPIELFDGMITESSQEWEESQRELATISTNSNHVIATQGGRFIHIDQPEIVIDAIRQMVEQVRAQ
jgi:pimeloyl-ACP methyl ester carboxylesterase